MTMFRAGAVLLESKRSLDSKTYQNWRSMPTKLTNDVLAAAIEGFEAQKKRIDGQIKGLRTMLDGERTEPVAESGGAPRKRRVSAAARRRMAIAQKARWAKVRGESRPQKPAAKAGPPVKRRISEEGMKGIIAATKKRWALVRAAAAKTAK